MAGLKRINKYQFKEISTGLLQTLLTIVGLYIIMGPLGLFMKVDVDGFKFSDIILSGSFVSVLMIFTVVMAITSASTVRLYLFSGITRKDIFVSNIIWMGILALINSGFATLVGKLLLTGERENIYHVFNFSEGLDTFFKTLVISLVIYSVATLLVYAFKSSVIIGVITLIVIVIIFNIVVMLSVYFSNINIFKNSLIFIVSGIIFLLSLLGSKIMLNKI